eukprot:TRINITY_DN25561_c0_g1_i1.p1 TRINITY_DN25561_c0_g1~~TRINITY_DN25561_c0_g1_i1.p1  ORF type:complete len:471 (-),score=87.60 TRINITY_DN25561_c0_g1_i1:2-1414(-)
MAAAAAGGWRRGTVIGHQIGRQRVALANSMKGPEDTFLGIFHDCRGTGPERLQKALRSFSKMSLGRKMNFKAPGDEDMRFLLKLADRSGGRPDNDISEEEAAFAFRVWIGFERLHAQVESMFDELDTDQSGELNQEELTNFLVELNDGCRVSPADVKYVMNYVDMDQDGSLDKQELVFGTCVWYCNIQVPLNSLTTDMDRTDSMADDLEEPDAKLKVIINGAHDLRNADGMGRGLSDPFCVCKVPGRPKTVFKTATVQNSLSPVWNHTGFISEFEAGDSLEFAVYDEDLMGRSDLLGQTVFPFSELYPSGFNGERMLDNAGPKQGKACVQLRIVILEDLHPAADADEPKQQADVQSYGTPRPSDCPSSGTDAERRLSTQSDRSETERRVSHQSDRMEEEEEMVHVQSDRMDEERRTSVVSSAEGVPSLAPLDAVMPPATPEDLGYPEAPDISQPHGSGPDVEPLMSWGSA